MNINILAGAPNSSSQPRSSQPADSDASGFARLLEQAAGQTTAATATTTEETRPALATAASLPAPPAVQLGTELLAANATPLPSSAAAELPASISESPLDEIRRRMALIEQAGQLPDTAAAAGSVAPMLVPTSPTTPGAASPTAAETPALERSLDAAGRLAGNFQPPADSTTAQHNAASASNEMPTLQSGDGAARSEALASTPLGMSVGPTASTNALAGNPVAASLSAPLASRDWQTGLGQQLIGLHQRGEQHIELHLHPAELGPLSVSLKLTELGAQAQFLSAHPQVRAAVEQAIPQLREALATQGITLGDTSVGSQSQPQRDGQAGTGSGNLRPAAAADGDAAAELATAVAPPRRVPLGQVDLYA